MLCQVENSFRWVKYGESPDGTKKAVSKKTSMRFLLQLCIREYRYREVNWEVKASGSATRSRSDKSTQDHHRDFSDGITDHAYTLANEQWVQSAKYDVQRCSCSEDASPAAATVQWRVKLLIQPKATSLPVRLWWRTRIVSAHPNDAAKPTEEHHLRCSCPYWRAWGIPCRHVLRVFRLHERRLVLADVDIRYWVEMYRANPNTIRDLLWSPTGIFERVMPEGPAIKLTPIVLMSPDCQTDCDDPTVLSSWVDGDPTTANPVDFSDPMGISAGTSNTRPSLFSTRNAEHQTTLYTCIKTICEKLCVLSSDHPTVEQPVLSMLQSGLSDMLDLLPEKERPSAKDGREVPALRGKLSRDDRGRGKGEHPKRKKNIKVRRKPTQQKAPKKPKKGSNKSAQQTKATLNRQNWDTVKRQRRTTKCT